MNTDLTNVTLARQEKRIPCFLCGDEVTICSDKNQKPYFICNECGVQAFIRRKQGIKLLAELELKFKENAVSTLEIMDLTNCLISLENQLAKLNQGKGIFDLVTPREEIIAAENAINSEIQNIKNQIDALKSKNQREEFL